MEEFRLLTPERVVKIALSRYTELAADLKLDVNELTILQEHKEVVTEMAQNLGFSDLELRSYLGQVEAEAKAKAKAHRKAAAREMKVAPEGGEFCDGVAINDAQAASNRDIRNDATPGKAQPCRMCTYACEVM